ncbi:Diphosphoinositol polyphosphate phosphohydrolase 3-beta [Halotydeus destructor]|nr:Diphosphoinositol polyphosphate phosphohydrolase 3-beta [Halotydeus destructor]
MVKEKPNSTRTYYEDGFRKRAACICVRNELENEVLLITSSGKPDRWIVPGGGLEPNELDEEAAIREVIEEAGVIGVLNRPLGTFECISSQNLERKHRTSVYVLLVTKELEEWDDSKSIGRQRKWFSVNEALQLLAVHKPVQVEYVKLLKNQAT